MTQASKPLSVSIILPNWNGAHLLANNLPFVLKAAPNAQIIVSDDCSTDQSVALVRKMFPNIVIVENSQRTGFSGNVNRGSSVATGEILILLNTDVRPQIGFLPPLLSHFESENVAAVGCLEKSIEHGKVVLRGRGVAGWKKGFYIHRRGEVHKNDTAWVSGGSCAIRRAIWLKMGGMDELFNPFYWEDIDLSYRIRKSGYSIIFEKDSIVKHYHEEGKIKTSFSDNMVKRIAYRNMFIFHWKNISNLKLWLVHDFWSDIRLLQAFLSGDFPMVLGYFDALIRLPKIIINRKKASKYWIKSDYTLT